MVFHSDDEHWAVNPHDVVKAVLDAHEFYKEKRVDERYESMALDLVRRYVWKEGLPRETDPFFGAALFVVTRHPWSHPNPLTKTEFAAKLRMKESSLDWYTDSIYRRRDQGTPGSAVKRVVGALRVLWLQGDFFNESPARHNLVNRMNDRSGLLKDLLDRVELQVIAL